MKASQAPAFLKRPVTTRSSLKTARRRAKAKGAERFAGDTGTPEMKQRQVVLIEARARSLKGDATVVGARVEAQLPHDRYRVRNLLEPNNAWKNERFWDAAERLRRDFHESGLAARIGSSFQPRVSGGDGSLAPDKAIEAMKRYKKAVNSLGVSLRSPLFYICICGDSAEGWATRNAKRGSDGIVILRQALAELAHFYGYARLNPATDDAGIAQ